MKQYSMITALLRHPLKGGALWLVYFFIWICFLPQSITRSNGTVAMCIDCIPPLLAVMFTLKHHYNHKIKKYARKGMVPPKGGLLWKAAKKGYAASNQRKRAFEGTMESAVYSFLKDPFPESASDAAARAYRQEQNQKAKARWDARNNQKKAEWDAKDAALRGKDIAARQYSYKADYWKKESKKY